METSNPLTIQPGDVEGGRTASRSGRVEKETACCGIAEKDEDDVEFGCVLGPLLLSLLIVVAGTASTITSKLQYEVRSEGFDHCKYHDDDGHADDDRVRRSCLFTKPWFQTLVMKVAMSTCLFLTYASQWRLEREEKRKAKERSVNGEGLGDGLLGADGVLVKQRQKPSWKSLLFIAIPAMTDLLQTVLSQAGLLWVSSSTYQMTRGSVIVFTCFLSIRYMGKVMSAVHWAAVGIVCVAVLLVGVSGVYSEAGAGGASVGEAILGLLLILLGQVVGAVQFVLEEWLMADCHVSPTLLVGWEGLWGICYFVVLAPILSITPAVSGTGELASASTIWHENFAETWDQLKNSTDLILLTAGSMVALLIYNLVGNMVTKQLNAIMRSILESCRTLGVWVVSIAIYYCTPYHDSKAGEKLTYWSILELVGFFFLVYGTAAYKEIVPIPFISKKAPASSVEQ